MPRKITATTLLLLLAVALAHPAQAQWTTGKDIDPIDDSTTVYATLDAVKGANSITRRPVYLFASCRSADINVPALTIHWGEYLGSVIVGYSVTYRFPPAPAQTSDHWIRVERATALRHKEAVISLLQELVQHERLVVRSEGSSTTAIFDLDGARAALKPIAEQCGFQLPGPSPDK